MKQNFFSNYYLLTRTFTFIQKRLQREVIRRMASTISGSKIVLDVGCGGQPYGVLFSNCLYIPMDLSIERRPTVVADARSIPVKSETVDCVLCTEVIEHVFDYGEVIREIKRVLRPGGKLILTAPMSWGLHYEPHDFWRFTPYSLRKILEDEGFEVEKMERVGGLFSFFGSRLVEGIALQLWRRLHWLHPRVRHGLILLFSIPVSLLFGNKAIDLLDRMIPTDYIGNALVAVKKPNA